MNRSTQKIVAAFLAFIMLAATPLTVFAAELNPIYTYDANGWEFEKISHASSPVETADGIVDYTGFGSVAPYVEGESEIGKGDRGQSYSYASCVYGDWVYINTMYGGLGIAAIIKNLVIPGMDGEIMDTFIDVLYNGNLYKGEPDGVQAGGILLKFNVKTGETEILMSQTKNGLIPTFRNACVLNGKMYFVGMILDVKDYAGDFVGLQTAMALQNGKPCLYEVDPETDEFRNIYECVDFEGYKELIADNIFPSTRAVGTYKGALVTGGIRPEGAYIAISKDPSAGQDSFVEIAQMEDLFNYPAYRRDDVNGGGGIYQVIEYNESLYVVICTGSVDTTNEYGTKRPFAIVRGDCSGEVDDPASWSWTAVVGDPADGAKYTFGIDPERISSGACSLEIYGGYLYIGEYNDTSSALQNFAIRRDFTTLASNLEQSVNLYRMDKDENIEMVVGDATEMFPEGGISGWGSGYLANANQYTWQTTVYDGKLYLSTMDATTVLRPLSYITNGEIIDMTEEEWISQINYIRVLLELLFESEEEANAPVLFSAEEPVMDEETARFMIEAAVEQAEIRAAESKTSTFGLFPEELPELDITDIILTDEQIDELIFALLDSEFFAELITKVDMETLIWIMNTLESVRELLKSVDVESFLEIYNELLEEYQEIYDSIPENLKPFIETILSAVTAENAEALLKVLYYIENSEAGFDLYEIKQNADKSVDIRTLTSNGFGDQYNHGLRIFAKTDDYFVIGTANPFYGTQLWRAENPENKNDENEDNESSIIIDMTGKTEDEENPNTGAFAGMATISVFAVGACLAEKFLKHE
ncbi:MAG: hypothetical protein IJO01_03690 [Oscillospiraceae bacterium]|nr:hypothetical protein [Oscillospiraceae bacterium]